MNQTIEQQRAAHAWERVQKAKTDATKDDFKLYSQQLQGLPVMIHTAGLGQTVAFYLAKGKAEHTRILEDLAGWLLRKADAQNRQPANLMKAIQSRSSAEYRLLTDETHAYLAWLKRFAAAQDRGDAN
jgi:CRISPR-associated protein Cmr5